jgi:WD40 repeat protein
MSGDCGVIATGDSTGEARIWDTFTGKLLSTMIVCDNKRPVRCVDMNNDASLLATGDENKTVASLSHPASPRQCPRGPS